MKLNATELSAKTKRIQMTIRELLKETIKATRVCAQRTERFSWFLQEFTSWSNRAWLPQVWTQRFYFRLYVRQRIACTRSNSKYLPKNYSFSLGFTCFSTTLVRSKIYMRQKNYHCNLLKVAILGFFVSIKEAFSSNFLRKYLSDVVYLHDNHGNTKPQNN